MVDTIRKVGQQSLAVFVSSLVIAQMIGAFFKVAGSSLAVVALGNIIGFAALIAIAYGVGWFKSQPWRHTPATPLVQTGPTTIPDGIPASKAD